MRPRRFHAANQVAQLPGGTEDNDLWNQRMIVEDETIGRHPALRSVYVPTDEERAAIAAGANISLIILAVEQPPIVMETTDEPLGKGPYRLWRGDGWPLCPGCGADELYSLDTYADARTIAGCYACDWTPGP